MSVYCFQSFCKKSAWNSLLACKATENVYSRIKGNLSRMEPLDIVIKWRVLTDAFRPGIETDTGFSLHPSGCSSAIAGKHLTPSLHWTSWPRKLLLCGGKKMLLIHSFFKWKCLLQNAGITYICLHLHIQTGIFTFLQKEDAPLQVSGCRACLGPHAGPGWWKMVLKRAGDVHVLRICAAK